MHHLLTKSILTILVIFTTFQAAVAMAADHIVDRAYFEDKSGKLVLDQVQQQEFIPYKGLLGKSYSPSAFWIRLRIQPDTFEHSKIVPGDNKLILRIRPTYLDEIQLFDPLQPATQPRVTGDRFSWSQSEYPSLNFNFVIPQGDTQRDIFLRLKTTSVNLIYIEALSFEENFKSDTQQSFTYSFYFALQALLLFWATAYWITLRERVVGVFAFKQLIGILFALSYLGYSRTQLSGDFPAPWFDNLTSLLICLYTTVSIFYDINLLREFNPPKWGFRLLILFIAMLPVEIILMLSNETRPALQLNGLVQMAELPLMLLLAIKAEAWKNRAKNETPLISRKILIGLYALIMFTYYPFILIVFGFIKGLSWSVDYPLYYALTTGVTLFTVLQLRAYRMGRHRTQAITQLAVAKMQVAQEQQKRMEQAKFLSMLAHELKTPLAVMRMMLGSHPPSPKHMEHAERAVRDMNDVIERCLQAGKLDDQQFETIKSETSIEEVLSELQLNSTNPERLNVVLADNTLFRTDEQILRIILSNLIDNAIKYSSPESMIDILVEHEIQNSRAGLAITVENLPGTAAWPDSEKVFKKYYRNKRAHHKTGSGLGLYLVANLASLLEGEIRYTPDNTKIRFSLWLPL